MKLSRPLMRFENDAFLALHEAHRIIATGDTRIRSLEEVAEVDFEFENDTFTAIELLRWLEDYMVSLPPEVKELVERGVKE